MIMFIIVTLLICSCQGQSKSKSQSQSECSDSELQEVQSQFNNCTVQLEYQFEDTRDTLPGLSYVEEAACVLISKTIAECGKLWEKCHTKTEVQRLQDMHLESQLAQHSSSLSLAKCTPVSEYLQSGRREENDNKDDKCSDRRSVQGQQSFQMCSHAESTEAYENILDLEDSDKIRNILCNTLGRIGSVCRQKLEECFSSEDLVRMTRNHLVEMEKFLVSFAGGEIGEEDLKGCGEAEESGDLDIVDKDEGYSIETMT